MNKYQEPALDALNETIEAFQRMSVPDGPPDAAILEQLGAGSPTKGRPVAIPCPSKPSVVRMRWLIPWAAAAALAVVGLGLLLSDAASLALADVVKATAKHQLVRYQELRITDTREQTGAVVGSTVYADFTAPRLYSESRVKDENGESVLLSVHDGRRHLTTNSRLNNAELDLAPKGYKWLLCCLEEFEQKKGVTQEKSDLDDRPAVKYRHVEGRQTTVLWVDANSKLPLRMEQESIDPSPGITRSTLVWTDFAWDPELPAGVRSLNELFSTQPPDGYNLDDQTRNRMP
jgi:hypothetical protein